MKHKVFFIILFLFSIVGVAQQTAMTESESKYLREKVIEKSNKTTSIVSNFEQYKHLDFLSNDIKSSGKMAFEFPNSIKWEYEEPFKYSVIFKNDKLYINDDGVKSDIDLSSNKMFKSLNNLIIKSVRGDMFDETRFEIVYYKTSQNYVVSFSPMDKNMKSFISEFILTFDKESLNVVEVKMVESSEDYTLLKFVNQKLNESVSDALFSN